MMRNSPERVLRDGLCIGCGVCSIAFPDRVTMGVDETGFLSPRQSGELTRVEAAMFSAFCPARGYEAPKRDGARPSATWGPVVSTRSGWSTRDDIRRIGSSGGVLTALSAYLLASDRVDAVVSVAMSPENPFENLSVVIRTPEEARTLSGSRYSPAAPFQRIVDLHLTERIAVIGKPCDISGMRRYYESNRSRLPHIEYFLSFFCAGTPSWKATVSAAQRLGVDPEEVRGVRYRGNGWPGYFTVQTKHNSMVTMTYEQSWGQILNKQLHTRCKLCEDGMGTYADIVAADHWDTDERGYPKFTDGHGRSLVLTRTMRGEALVTEAASEQYLQLHQASLENLAKIQPSQVLRKQFAAVRGIGYWLGGRHIPWFRGYPRWRWAVRKPMEAARQLVGSYGRARLERRKGELLR